MQALNYAFITALYVNKSTGLYKDIYFPIIKYAVVMLYNNRELGENSKFFTAEDISNYIFEKVQIRIPNVVIAITLVKMKESRQKSFDMALMENGNSIRIDGIIDEDEFEGLEEQEKHFSSILAELEQDYQMYLVNNGCYDDGVTFLQLISDNTEDFLGYFEDEDRNMVNEKYTTVIFFLEYLKSTSYNCQKFQAANQLFWASIIAAYLRSERPPVDADNDGVKYEYFLDTSIVMGLIDLASKQRESYAKEIRDIIRASGGIMRVHPITLREISKILSTVEQRKEPQIGTNIAEAWHDHHLDVQQLAGKRVRLQQLVESEGVSMFPHLSENNLRQIETSYKMKSAVSDLSKIRSGRPASYSMDNFREIHDVFMDDYICIRREEKKSDDTITFVTANRELISFSNHLHPGDSRMTSTGRIILDLWMHNAKPSDISNCALTETMARCLDLHSVQVRSKLAEVSKYFKLSKDKFDPQVYRDFIKNLYRRARHVITTVEEDVNNDSLDATAKMQRIADAVASDLKAFDERLKNIEQKNNQLSQTIAEHKDNNETLAQLNANQKSNIEALQEQKSKLSEDLAKKDSELDSVQKMVKTERKAKEDAEHILNMYKRKSELEDQLSRLDAQLAPFEKSRKDSFCDWQPVAYTILGFLFIALAIWVGYLTWSILDYKFGAFIGGLVALACFMWTRAASLNDKYMIRAEKAHVKWEKRAENQQYHILLNDKNKVNNELTEIKKEIGI